MHDTMARIRTVATVELVPDRTARRVIAVAAFAIATALGAHVAVPLTPVPVTLQTLFVVLAGAMLGPKLGAASQLAYLGMGIAGLPVFAGGFGLAYLVGPTGGYLLAFPATAFVAGMVARRVSGRGIVGAALLFVGLFLASLVTLGGGTAWLAILTGDPATAVALGFLPFLAGDVLKVGLATLLAWRARGRVHRLL
jgi:biotin transport system substrate-specific component